MVSVERVLFVCTANICRSPSAAAIFNDLAFERGLPFSARSAGVSTRGGHEMAPLSREALGEIGVHAGPHTSRRISREILQDADLVLVMEPLHASRIEDAFGDCGKVNLLSAYATFQEVTEEIADPYGLTIFAYRASVRQLYHYVAKTVERLASGRT